MLTLRGRPFSTTIDLGDGLYGAFPVCPPTRNSFLVTQIFVLNLNQRLAERLVCESDQFLRNIFMAHILGPHALQNFFRCAQVLPVALSRAPSLIMDGLVFI
jgi:hypothetical protein